MTDTRECGWMGCGNGICEPVCAGIDNPDTAPAHILRATRAVLAERERELLELKGPCSSEDCVLHYAHSGPCDIEW